MNTLCTEKVVYVRNLIIIVIGSMLVSKFIAGIVASNMLLKNNKFASLTTRFDHEIVNNNEIKLFDSGVGRQTENVRKDIKVNFQHHKNQHETPMQCAPWISSENRKVLFVELHTWKIYHGPSKYKTGEYYVSACWDYALRKNGFSVDRVSTRHFFERMTEQDISVYHRIFFRDPKWHRHFDKHDILCKARPMYYFGDWYYGKKKENPLYNSPFDEKQILVAHPEDHNTFMGYFPHNLLDPMSENPTKLERGKVGLLYGKKPEYFKDHYSLIEKLLESGFELHTTCADSSREQCHFPPEVIRHHHIGPDEYAEMMKSFSFMLGFGDPVGSPSPLVGLSHGVAFLNPLRKTGEQYTQHKALSRLGMPYVYNVDLHDIDGVVRAAQWASRYRFHQYIPSEFKVDSLTDRMCALLEDDALCDCPNPNFGYKNLDWRIQNRTDHKMDCRASSYTRKSKVMPLVQDVN